MCLCVCEMNVCVCNVCMCVNEMYACVCVCEMSVGVLDAETENKLTSNDVAGMIGLDGKPLVGVGAVSGLTTSPSLHIVVRSLYLSSA